MPVLSPKHDERINYSSLLQEHALVFYGMVSEFQETDCLPVLSEKEIARAAQYLNPEDKSRYIIARALLKKLLAHVLQANEKQIEFQYTKNGKPFLFNNPDLQFNVSHSGDVFIIALAHEHAIGIDVERLNHETHFSKLQAYVFTDAELQVFQSLEHERQQEIFIDCWTKKEAILKATGEGLTRAMNTVEVLLLNKENTVSPGQLQTKNDWFLESFHPAKAYTASVAVKGQIKSVKYIPINQFMMLLN